MALTRLTISGFKSLGPEFDQLDLQPDLTVLIGPNGSGKSNILGALAFLGQVTRGNLQMASDGASQLLFQGPKVSPEMHFQVWGTSNPGDRKENGYSALLEHLPLEDRLRFKDEMVYFWDHDQHPRAFQHALGNGHRESRLQAPPEQAKSMASFVLRNALAWRLFHFHDTSPSSPPKQTCEADSGSTLRSDGGNLAAFLLNLRDNHPDSYQWIRSTIQQVAPFFEDFDLLPNAKGQLRLLWRQRGTEVALGPHHFSDGTLRFICLAALLLQPEPPPTIILDEPELGLHPFALNLLGELIRSASTRGQILLSTQSSLLVGHFQAEHIRIVETSSRGTRVRPVTAEELEPWLEDYTLGQIWEMNLIGGRP